MPNIGESFLVSQSEKGLPAHCKLALVGDALSILAKDQTNLDLKFSLEKYCEFSPSEIEARQKAIDMAVSIFAGSFFMITLSFGTAGLLIEQSIPQCSTGCKECDVKSKTDSEHNKCLEDNKCDECHSPIIWIPILLGMLITTYIVYLDADIRFTALIWLKNKVHALQRKLEDRLNSAPRSEEEIQQLERNLCEAIRQGQEQSLDNQQDTRSNEELDEFTPILQQRPSFFNWQRLPLQQNESSENQQPGCSYY
ncbi:hypothetical protein [Rickettsiella massiliensis]|uniref:hypothetical protein n=1 Tax=Rickettsiella massiliensis TaxID=676517 RepID=UPI000299EC13|nr:hypothetical protein [Rickettsiella massiliensis]